MRVIIFLLLLTGCTSTQVSMTPCHELDQSLHNSAHDEFLVESCIMNIQTKCDDPEGDCAKVELFTCMEQYFSLKKVQVRDYKTQKCWQFHVEQY